MSLKICSFGIRTISVRELMVAASLVGSLSYVVDRHKHKSHVILGITYSRLFDAMSTTQGVHHVSNALCYSINSNMRSM